ncbi:DUF4232 domain-containing protein [Streptomyces sp. NPDC053048]|uniref:DUF4232 domain-containing protein n=1 Tax=Streptomyces sp. NPDC053048 TaxID=3365694 RepID=UPI0037D871B2
MNTPPCKNHKSLRGWKSYALGAAAVTTLLAPMASEASAADGSDRLRLSGWSSTTSSAKPRETVPAKPGGTLGNTGRNGNSGGENAIAACAKNALAVSAVRQPEDGQVVRHLLITAQNLGDKKCNLYRHPHIRLGADAQSTAPVIEDSDPGSGAPVTIAPGEEAHAALLVSGGARDVYEAKRITLSLQGRQLGSDASEPIDVPMPVDTLYADDGQLVTYWTTASGFALDFIMSK